ncbi:Transposon Ty3-G Gag-Pol poly, partial [Paramuricea clavata]
CDLGVAGTKITDSFPPFAYQFFFFLIFFLLRKEADESGERLLYRPKGWNKEERTKEKIRKKKNWYAKGRNESVIFVPATPRSQLQREYQQEIRNLGFNINVVEKAGNTLKKMLQRPDPFKPENRGKNDCLVCTTGEKGPCGGHGVTYDIRCNTCNDVYLGETSRSAYMSRCMKS